MLQQSADSNFSLHLHTYTIQVSLEKMLGACSRHQKRWLEDGDDALPHSSTCAQMRIAVFLTEYTLENKKSGGNEAC